MIKHSQTSATIVSTPTRRRHHSGGLRPMRRRRQVFTTCDVPAEARHRGPEKIVGSVGVHVVALRHAGGTHTPEAAQAIARHLDDTCIHGRSRDLSCCDGMVHNIALPVWT